MKYLTVLLLSGLVGCGYEVERAPVIGATSEFDIKCVDGVEYLINYIGYYGVMSGHFKPDGTLYTCEDK